MPQSRAEIGVFPAKDVPDLEQGKSDELECHDLLQTREVAIGVHPVPGTCATARLEQPEAIVVVQGADCDSGALSEFVSQIGAVHGSP